MGKGRSSNNNRSNSMNPNNPAYKVNSTNLPIVIKTIVIDTLIDIDKQFEK